MNPTATTNVIAVLALFMLRGCLPVERFLFRELTGDATFGMIHYKAEIKNMNRNKQPVATDKSKPQPLRLIDLVDYQKDSVVSREILSKKTGTVTLFAFDQGQGLSEHTTPHDAIACILDGEAQITISRNLHRLKPGEIIIMPANQPHALKAVKKFKMLLIMIRS